MSSTATAEPPTMLVAVCLKWVDLRPEVDPLTGAVEEDPRSFGLSAADQAALEWALRLGASWSVPVLALSAGPPAAEAGLREALACGATRAMRVDMALDVDSSTVAGALAGGLRAAGGPAIVCCGDRSADRGSGSVPAYLAARLGAVQALGLVALSIDEQRGTGGLLVERRLDRGRRERLRLQGPAVVSVEGGSARLRRAGLPALLAARRAEIEQAVPQPAAGRAAGRGASAATDTGASADTSLAMIGTAFPTPVRVEHRGPFRPRPRVQAAPDAAASPRDRILNLTGAHTDRTPPRTVQASPDEAARLLLEQLRSWGYVE